MKKEERTPNKVVQFIKENGFDKAVYLTHWEGYEVYEARYNSEEVPFIGLPQFILYREGKIRFTAFEEYQKISNSLR
jgi:hypothetical protein